MPIVLKRVFNCLDVGLVAVTVTQSLAGIGSHTFVWLFVHIFTAR